MTGRRANILVMDGDAGSREGICEALLSASYRCVAVTGPDGAKTAARVEPIDVALLDTGSTPDATILRLARALREQVGDLAVVLVTRDGNLGEALDAMRLGVFDYLFKPFRERDLLEAVGRAVQWRTAALEQRAAAHQLERQLEQRLDHLRTAIAAAGIASTPALDHFVACLYAGNRAALEHTHRVRHHASGVASMLGLTGGALEDVARAALLHDLGRLALPEAVVAKPTPLTDHEMTLFRGHPEFAAALMRPVPFLNGAASIVASTRERHDGSGYPLGLRGDEVPLGSAIVAMVELFDSLTGVESFGAASAATVANAELIRAAGTCFDPFLVARWLRYAETGLLQPVQPARGAH
jgi:response regulator RpfG family c-di-GMP phosphodiesterase